jgi:DNA-binding response OmpR family regulator
MENSGRRIVMVQTDPYLVETRKAILEKNGYEVRAVHTVDEARAACRNFLCDLVIVDSEQNHKLGLELCEEIKLANPTVNVAVIAWYDTPANSDCPDEVIRREKGPHEFLTKVKAALDGAS